MDFKILSTSIVLLLTMFALPSLASAMSITVGIPGNYAEVKAGNSVYFSTEVKWPENNGRKDLRIEYSVKDLNGKEVAYLKVLKAIETQASFMDSIVIAESMPSGIYRIYANVSDYQDLNQEVTASFKVINNNGYENILLIIIGILGIIIVIGTVDLFFVIKKHN